MSFYVRSAAGVGAAFRLRHSQAKACGYHKKICNVRVNTQSNHGYHHFFCANKKAINQINLISLVFFQK